MTVAITGTGSEHGPPLHQAGHQFSVQVSMRCRRHRQKSRGCPTAHHRALRCAHLRRCRSRPGGTAKVSAVRKGRIADWHRRLMAYSQHLVIPDRSGTRVLLLEDGSGWRLPITTDSDWMLVGGAQSWVRQRLGLDIVVLRCVLVDEHDTGEESGDAYLFTENLSDQTPLDGSWRDEEAITALMDERDRTAVTSVVHGAERRQSTSAAAVGVPGLVRDGRRLDRGDAPGDGACGSVRHLVGVIAASRGDRGGSLLLQGGTHHLPA